MKLRHFILVEVLAVLPLRLLKKAKSYGDLLAFKWATDAKGNRIVTAAGKPVLTATQEFIGNFNPKATIGFTNTINFKNFSLRVLMDGRVGGIIISGTEMNLAFSGIPEVTAQFREGGWNLGGVDATGAASYNNNHCPGFLADRFR